MRRLVYAGVAISLVITAITASSTAFASRGRTPRTVDGTARIVAAARLPHVHRTGLSSWAGSFTLGGTTYPYTMLGTNPAAGSRTTTLRVDLIPLRLTFDNGGITLDGHDTVNDVIASPVFQRADYRSGHTQFGDAMQRAEFWNDVQRKSPGYHVLLAHPKVLPTVPIEVPPGSGFAVQNANGPSGVVTTPFLLSLLPRVSEFYDPGAVLVFLVKDVAGDSFLGFHFAFTPTGQSVPQTLIFTGVFTPGIVTDPAHSDVYVLSHEIAEWINDPGVNNIVPQWINPGDGTCFSNLLEVGDPVEFLPNDSFPVTTHNRSFHVTDVAGVSWFAHDVPSRELGGDYSYNGTLKTFSNLC